MSSSEFADNDTIQGLWIGPELSVMEQLCISSFLAHGHEFHLYVYADVRNVPSGTVVRDGNDILHESFIFRYRENGSLAGFANYFRYDLLLRRGGWWVDLDVVCLRPFQFQSAHVLGHERLDLHGVEALEGRTAGHCRGHRNGHVGR